jgi:hypothetical protein
MWPSISLLFLLETRYPVATGLSLVMAVLIALTRAAIRTHARKESSSRVALRFP